MENDVKVFNEGLLNTFRAGLVEYDKFTKSKLARFSAIEVSRMGNFTDPSTGNEYGFKLIIGKPDFFEGNNEEEDEEDLDMDM